MLNFYSITLSYNKKTIEKCINNLSRFYENKFTFTIVCPRDSCTLFKEIPQKTNIRVISEEEIISFSDFKNLAINICKKVSVQYNQEIPVTEKRLGWYYQQVLKLACLLKESRNKKLTIIEADTFPIKKLNFFNGDKSILFTTHYEKNKPYLETMNTIYNLKIPYKSWKSYTCQLNSLTPYENKAIIKELANFVPKTKDMNLAEWITTIMITGVVETHKKLGGELFSEQDFIGFFLRYKLGTKPKNILFLRSFVKYKFSNKQELIASKLGFSHITYESWLIKDKKSLMPWSNFIFVLIITFLLPSIKKVKLLIVGIIKNLI